MKLKSFVAVLVAATILIGAFPQDAAAGWQDSRKFTSMYVFGDSLSDPGNAYAVTGAVATGTEPIPSAPYDVNGNRFTNGPTWVEVLARQAFLLRGALPALKYPTAGNYAFGGARAGSDSPALDLPEQIGLFLTNNDGVAPDGALYVIQFGGNDVNQALTAATPAEAQTAVLNAVTAIKQNILLLKSRGARQFLVANAPNLGRVPVVRAIGAEVPAEQLSLLFNGLLDAAMAELAAGDVEIYRINLFAFLDAASEYPQGLGFAGDPNPLTAPCLPVFIPTLGVCEDPDQRFYWDGLHPTRAAHRIAGNIAYNVLGLAGD
jgi:outer membrane lipase/esterase